MRQVFFFKKEAQDDIQKQRREPAWGIVYLVLHSKAQKWQLGVPLSLEVEQKHINLTGDPLYGQSQCTGIGAQRPILEPALRTSQI